MKTVKRKANVGERILITDGSGASRSQYGNGAKLTVTAVRESAVSADGISDGIFHEEYEVIIEEAGEMDEVIAKMQAELDELKEKVSALEFVLGEGSRLQQKSPQQIRDEIVERAKADLEGLKDTHHPTMERFYSVGYVGVYEADAEFILNREKRTTVCLLRKKRYDGNGAVVARGIAKAAPADCFNVHIGRAISLRRALGLEVPAEYLNAPQPEEVRAGDVVEMRWIDRKNPDPEFSVVAKVEEGKAEYTDGQHDSVEFILRKGDETLLAWVCDDSREG